MSSTSETGHAINVAHLETLISVCTGFGIAYNPVKISIKVASLNTLRTAANNSLTAVITTNTTLTNAVNARQIIFDPIKPFATRLINALANTDATNELIKDAKTINRKIQGARKGPKITPPAPTPENPNPEVLVNQISVSQQSYDNKLAHLTALVALVLSEPTYAPNEIDLQAIALNALTASMTSANTAVINATTDANNAINARNQTLYAPETGLYDITLKVKKYVLSVYNARHPNYKMVTAIKFRKLVVVQ